MTITEFATIILRSPHDLSDPTVRSHFRTLSTWQSDCSGFPLRFFTNANDRDALEVHLVTGWTSVAAHEAWIRGERNQELLRVFAPYVDIPRVRMVHVSVDFETIPGDVEYMVVKRYDRESKLSQGSEECTWELVGRDLGLEGGDTYRFIGAEGNLVESDSTTPIETWALKKVEL